MAEKQHNIEITIETVSKSQDEVLPLCKAHYDEMNSHFAKNNLCMAPFNARLDVFEKANNNGGLLLFVVRELGKAIGYALIYVTHDVHNFELIANDGAVYISPEKRKSRAGILLIKEIHATLKSMNVTRFFLTTMTDLRVTKLLDRMGYKHMGNVMGFNLKV